MGPLSALALGRRLAEGAAGAAEVCEESLARAGAAELRHAFLVLTAERARREARESDERLRSGRAAGPLDGVPVAWKDLFDLAGLPTTAGSLVLATAPPAAADAPVVASLRAAGMVCVGKTNLTELAFSGLGLNPHHGTPRNPWSPPGAPRIPGGSSSGSAVAVAAGAVPCAIGTDTSGSVRVPAAFCGIVGFKPTAARFDRTGMLPLAATLDSVGPLARTVDDVVALDAALRGARIPAAGPAELPGAPIPAAGPAARPEFVVPLGELAEDLDPGVAERFADAAARIAAAGLPVRRRRVRALERAQAAMDEHGSVVAFEAARLHAELVDGPDGARLDPRVRTRLRSSRSVSPEAYRRLLELRTPLARELAGELGAACVLFPTVRHTAPLLEPLERDDELFGRTNARTLRSTMLGSYLDMPGVSLPIGVDGAGLPVGLLVSGPAGTDAAVLAAARAVEAVTRS